MSDQPGRSDGPDIPISDQHFSVHVSRTLDCLGKSRDMVKYRVKKYREIQRLTNILSSGFVLIIAGSKGEGLTSLYENDDDLMIVDPHIMCADNAVHFINKSHDVVFQTERHDTPAGYTKLKVIQCSNTSPLQYSLYQGENGKRYMSSDFFMTIMEFVNMKSEEDGEMKGLGRSGPSLPKILSAGTVSAHLDIVRAFCCVCPDLLQTFIARPRLYNRPDTALLNDISKLESHVVPVGCKGSETSYQEWRICFTKAEIRLINSFNDTETKLYILLKMVSKNAKTVSNGLTSYVMKNVVLWLIELYPVGMFTEEQLTTRLIQGLVFLKQCVEANFLPSYMIPERNLLPQKFDPLQKHGLTAFLNELIKEEGYALMRFEKLRVAMLIMYQEPGMAKSFRLLRDLAEKLVLYEVNLTFEKHISAGVSLEQARLLVRSDEKLKELVVSICLVPEWRVLIMSGCSLDSILELHCERHMLILS